MSKHEMIARQYEYGCWARAKLLRRAEELSDDEYHAQTELGRVHEVFTHMLAVEWMWRNIAQTGTVPGQPPGKETIMNLEQMKERWQKEEDDFRTAMAAWTEDDLEEFVDTVSPRGDAFTFARWEMVQHMLLHSMQHRTEAAAILTSHGKSPGDLDYIFFMMS